MKSSDARRTMVGLLFTVATLLSGYAAAQSLPVAVQTAGNTATVQVGNPASPLADVTLTFDDASGLSAASLGVSAQVVEATDPALLARLPGQGLARVDASFPVLITIEPPSSAGLSFLRTVRVEIHTHALTYSVGSFYRLFKAPLGGNFRDITDEVIQGSVRARGTTNGFSQFLVLPDLRRSDDVITAKLVWLRARVAALPDNVQPSYTAKLDSIETAVAAGNYDDAIATTDSIRAQATAQAGRALLDQWRATHDVDNQAGGLIAGAATLKFSLTYLRDFGQ